MGPGRMRPSRRLGGYGSAGSTRPRAHASVSKGTLLSLPNAASQGPSRLSSKAKCWRGCAAPAQAKPLPRGQNFFAVHRSNRALKIRSGQVCRRVRSMGVQNALWKVAAGRCERAPGRHPARKFALLPKSPVWLHLLYHITYYLGGLRKRGVHATPGSRLRFQGDAAFVAKRGFPRPLQALQQGEVLARLRRSRPSQDTAAGPEFFSNRAFCKIRSRA